MQSAIDEYFKQFIFECEFARKLRPETIRGYSEVFKTFRKLSPNIATENISSYDIASFFKLLDERKRPVGKLYKQGIKKSTLATYWSKLNSFFVWLEQRELIKENPLKKLPYPVPVYVDKKFLKKEEVEKIFTAIHLHHGNNILLLKRNLLLFTILLFCGLRREEVAFLQIRDIDLNRKILTVRAENSKSQFTRHLPLHSEIIMRLKDYMEARKNYSTQFLFVSLNRDDKMSYAGLRHIVKKLIINSKTKFHLHQFRHTFAMNYLKQSNNVFKLKELMGHKDIRMTQAYLRCMPIDELRADVESMSLEKLI